VSRIRRTPLDLVLLLGVLAACTSGNSVTLRPSAQPESPVGPMERQVEPDEGSERYLAGAELILAADTQTNRRGGRP
jgi:hypothetical protein